MPTWSELWRDLTSAPCPPLAGAYTVRCPRRDDGRGWPPPDTVTTVERFEFAPPGHWRRELDGRVIVREEGERVSLMYAEDGFPWAFEPSPERLVAPGSGGALAAAHPLADPAPAGHGGRAGWAVPLDAPFAGTLRLVVDAELPLVLLAETPGGAYREELTDLRVLDGVPARRFDPADAYAAEHAWERRWQAMRSAYHDRPLPSPAYWPAPLGEPTLIDGDPATGLLVVMLDVLDAPGPADARLARTPAGAPPYTGGSFGDPEVYVHRWRAGRWDWSLAVDEPLAPGELEKVIASMPAS
ncbi:hypothetical protein [Actinomadura parmotrematis]|uniref:DUF4241 domain-containing protein n=1 Tax=Actinomadura parmotrematis TaxID=2864039 RepID=A0ABS7FNF7_9ACTN|nr:hypothetical protein [Actinomadura parmotrematis]MBW8481122.1 hypothetical protein [Actinomadura parmotrematis]